MDWYLFYPLSKLYIEGLLWIQLEGIFDLLKLDGIKIRSIFFVE